MNAHWRKGIAYITTLVSATVLVAGITAAAYVVMSSNVAVRSQSDIVSSQTAAETGMAYSQAQLDLAARLWKKISIPKDTTLTDLEENILSLCNRTDTANVKYFPTLASPDVLCNGSAINTDNLVDFFTSKIPDTVYESEKITDKKAFWEEKFRTDNTNFTKTLKDDSGDLIKFSTSLSLRILSVQKVSKSTYRLYYSVYNHNGSDNNLKYSSITTEGITGGVKRKLLAQGVTPLTPSNTSSLGFISKPNYIQISTELNSWAHYASLSTTQPNDIWLGKTTKMKGLVVTKGTFLIAPETNLQPTLSDEKIENSSVTIPSSAMCNDGSKTTCANNTTEQRKLAENGGIFINGDVTSITLSANGTTQTITCNPSCGNSSTHNFTESDWTTSGSDNVSKFNGVIYATGSIGSVSGSIADFSRITIAAAGNITIKGSLTSGICSSSISINSGSCDTSKKGVLGILSTGGNIYIDQATSNVVINAFLMAENGSILNNKPVTELEEQAYSASAPLDNSAKIIGGMVQKTYGIFGFEDLDTGELLAGFSREVVYDARIKNQNTNPPGFPEELKVYTSNSDVQKIWNSSIKIISL